MTEKPWLAGNDPQAMLHYLIGLIGTEYRPVNDLEAFPDCRASDRKLRLIAAAAYRRVPHLLPHPLAREGVEVAEAFADGSVPPMMLRDCHAEIRHTILQMEDRWRASQGAERRAMMPTHVALGLAFQVTAPLAPKAAYYGCSNAAYVVSFFNEANSTGSTGYVGSDIGEERAQAGLLRDMIGPSPFRAIRFDPDWRARDILALARTIYDQRSFDRLPELAASLQEAGCDNGEVLEHLRGVGPHFLGMWSLDLVLGKAF